MSVEVINDPAPVERSHSGRADRMHPSDDLERVRVVFHGWPESADNTPAGEGRRSSASSVQPGTRRPSSSYRRRSGYKVRSRDLAGPLIGAMAIAAAAAVDTTKIVATCTFIGAALLALQTTWMTLAPAAQRRWAQRRAGGRHRALRGDCKKVVFVADQRYLSDGRP